jgi:16S rRNA G966 N2-methylase RsmD
MRDNLNDLSVYQYYISHMEKKIYVDKIFPLLKQREDYKNLKIDTESLMYVTNYRDSAQICNIVCEHIKKIKNPSDCVLIDATGGIGGDTITFAKRFLQVISIELDKHRYDFLKNNIDIYKFKNVIDINGDSLAIIPKLPSIDVIYIDPPWGGKSYKDKKMLRITMNDIELENIIIDFLSSEKMLSVPKVIAIKLPKNYDLKYMYDKLTGVGQNTMYLYELQKMYIVTIENFKVCSDQ